MIAFVPSWMSDSAVVAGAISVMIGCIFATGKLLKALAHVAEIPERLDRLDSKVDAFGIRLDEHLIAEEAAIHALTARLELVAERRTTPAPNPAS